ncbi:hypothetical protein ALC53_14113 [Atta colombica]|uniref:Uncharacterized protein n=1 Tax=Atta colombica TaxID=520822 RepID=A0A195ATN6_9HYME|nr:hypothetical protein ALC53_14113 [Atta colombica]
MKIFRKIFRNKKKKHIVNQKKRRTTKARNASRMHDAHLLKDDFLFGTGTRRSRPHRRKHKVCAKKRELSLDATCCLRQVPRSTWIGTFEVFERFGPRGFRTKSSASRYVASKAWRVKEEKEACIARMATTRLVVSYSRGCVTEQGEWERVYRVSSCAENGVNDQRGREIRDEKNGSVANLGTTELLLSSEA